jgi:hypothetical protein
MKAVNFMNVARDIAEPAGGTLGLVWGAQRTSRRIMGIKTFAIVARELRLSRMEDYE